MDEMKELVSEQAVETAMLALAVAGPLLGLSGGALWALAKKRTVPPALVRGLLVGLLGPLVWVLWRYYSWTVRYQPAPDPADDYFGLERVDVLLGNVVVFLAVGALIGWLVRRVRARDAAAGGDA